MGDSTFCFFDLGIDAELCFLNRFFLTMILFDLFVPLPIVELFFLCSLLVFSVDCETELLRLLLPLF